jgi:hypothetical protein
VLKQGSSGADVKALQKLLNEAGCHLQVDGGYGNATYHCVRWWQSQADPPVTGVMAKPVIARLRTWLANQITGGATMVQQPIAAPAQVTIAAPGALATIDTNGQALAPASAPQSVKAMIAAGNQIATTPYLWGGGHQSWTSPGGYDCSGSVSYVLHAAGLLDSPLVSGDLANWGGAGVGSWVTIYANATHVWMTIAGLRFDTGGLDSNPASRWQSTMVSTTGYSIRHPQGL